MKKITVSIKANITSKKVEPVHLYATFLDSLSNEDVVSILTPYLRSNKYELEVQDCYTMPGKLQDTCLIESLKLLIEKVKKVRLSYITQISKITGTVIEQEVYDLHLRMPVEITEEQSSHLFNTNWPTRYYSIALKDLPYVKVDNVSIVRDLTKEIHALIPRGVLVAIDSRDGIKLAWDLSKEPSVGEPNLTAEEIGYHLKSTDAGLSLVHVYERYTCETVDHIVYIY